MAWPSESATVALRSACTPGLTGFGLPVGPLLIVSVCGTLETCCVYEAFTVWPNAPSSTVTPMVQFWVEPVMLDGAVQDGDCTSAFEKLPPPPRAGQFALQW